MQTAFIPINKTQKNLNTLQENSEKLPLVFTNTLIYCSLVTIWKALAAWRGINITNFGESDKYISIGLFVFLSFLIIFDIKNSFDTCYLSDHILKNYVCIDSEKHISRIKNSLIILISSSVIGLIANITGFIWELIQKQEFISNYQQYQIIISLISLTICAISKLIFWINLRKI